MPEQLTLESLAARITEIERQVDAMFANSPVVEDTPVVVVEATESRSESETE